MDVGNGRSKVTEFLTLTQAAKLAPGRPSVNCVWRWCRRGVVARDGHRVRLQHIRSGGKIFTTAPWLLAFSTELAAADAQHFDSKLAVGAALPARDKRYANRSRLRGPEQRSRTPSSKACDVLGLELDQAGL